LPPLPLQQTIFQLSLDGGNQFFVPQPLDPGFNPQHVYTYEVLGTGQPLLARSDTNGSFNDYGQLRITVTHAVLEVSIDIKPKSDRNSINCLHNPIIAVAILTTSTAMGDPTDFDASTVESFTVVFGPGAASPAHSRAHIEDVDQDGDRDMILHFRQSSTGLQCGDVEACLVGETTDGTSIQGCDAVWTHGR
jgi:hypothetical protein